MPELKNKPTLADFQKYVKELEDERGFVSQTVNVHAEKGDNHDKD